MSPRAPKHCGRHGCHELVTGRPYCDVHTAEAQIRRNTTTRGYGAEHQRARRQALRALIPGQPCLHCGDPMTADQALDLDHTDDRTGYRGLAHRHCNSRAGAASKARPPIRG